MITKPLSAGSEHAVHALGIIAICDARDARNGVKNNVNRGTAWQLMTSSHVFTPSSSVTTPVKSLDELMIEIAPVLGRARRCFGSQLELLVDAGTARELALDIEKVFDALQDWARRQSSTWEPRVIGHMDPSRLGQKNHALYWPGPVYTYLDRKSLLQHASSLQHTER